MKALLSVFDKLGVVKFARDLHKAGAELISTGGTHQTLVDAGLPVQQVSDFTGSPEILGGRVKTLHPAIHGGILARRDNPGHVSELAELSMETIDVVAVNLYPFAATIKRPGVTLDDALENIDIGGPHDDSSGCQEFSVRGRGDRSLRLRLGRRRSWRATA